MADITETTEGKLKDSYITGQTGQKVELRGTLLKLTRYAVVFEMYNPAAVLRTSEVLQAFKIVVADAQLYSGTGVVRSVINTGSSAVVCEATLNENGWVDVGLVASNGQLSKKIGAEYQEFLKEWQKLYRVRSEFKLALADMQTYFTDLRLWLDQLELGVRAAAPGEMLERERELAAKLSPHTAATMNAMFENFEETVRNVGEDAQPAHQLFARRQLHPLLLCSPFLHRCYVKPLGYAGDYEMVNMMLRSPYEGESLFAKIVNFWFLQQAPAEAHRNRIDYLVRQLVRVSAQAASQNRKAQILNVACGPAQEVQRFLADHPISSQAEISLLDFNEETLTNTRALMTDIKRRHQRGTTFHYIKKSVYNIVKESGKTVKDAAQPKYDFVYCAGLFDYLSDQVCQHMMNVMYDWLAPGGLVVSTNVDSSNPRRLTMEYVMAWHLIYRTGAELAAVKPVAALAEHSKVISDATGVNVYLEVTKPDRE